MSPAPDLSDETIILNTLPTTSVLNGISSADEFDQTQLQENSMDLGSLTMESVSLSDDDEDQSENRIPQLTDPSVLQLTTCSAPSTPTGERDPPHAIRRPSVTANPTTTTTPPPDLPQMEVKYQGVGNTGTTTSDDGNGLFETFLGCFKPIFSAVNKIGENMKYHRDSSLTTTSLTKPTDEWEIPIENIMNDLQIIGTGNEGTVFRCKLGGQDVACKRVKNETETNIKHLRKLNHVNIVKFRGISISPPLFYIVMEYCPFGSLYDVLRRRREKNSCTKPTQVLDWARQIANGVNYLHANKFVHRDLKSPNILIAEQNVLKISDFGTTKLLNHRRNQPMSFNGTSAWMAPEVIRQEACSEKIDVWSFGIVLWEILTCAVPYHNIDPVAVMWGVGKGSLTLPIPSSAPEGLKLLMTLCWKQRSPERPSFQQIIKHLNICETEVVLFEQEQEYAELTRAWSIEINEQLSNLPTIDISSTLQMTNDELMKKRKEELQHIADIRSHYEKKLQQVNTLYLELSSLMMQLQKREQEIKKKERALKIQSHSTSSNGNGKKRSTKTFQEAREKSIELIKRASHNLNDPSMILSQSSNNKRSISGKISNTVPTTTIDPSTIKSSPSSSFVNIESSSNKTVQRRKKGPGHRRTNSKGSTASWTPPSLNEIARQEDQRASINIKSNIIENPIHDQTFSNDSNGPIPSISAGIDSKCTSHHRQLNPSTLKLDLNVSPTKERPTTMFTYLTRKSSSSDPEDHVTDQYYNSSRQQRRRRPFSGSTTNRLTSPSTRMNSVDVSTPQADENATIPAAIESDKNVDLKKLNRNVSFLFTPPLGTDRSPSFTTRKTFTRHKSYSSSEEGEAEDVLSDNYVLDDTKHRAKHGDIHRQSYGLFSSESEIYSETNARSTSSSSKHESAFSDEGGHVSDNRPASRESLLNSEPEQE